MCFKLGCEKKILLCRGPPHPFQIRPSVYSVRNRSAPYDVRYGIVVVDIFSVGTIFQKGKTYFFETDRVKR